VETLKSNSAWGLDSLIQLRFYTVIFWQFAYIFWQIAYKCDFRPQLHDTGFASYNFSYLKFLTKGKYIYYAEGGDEDVKGGHRNIFWH
jgi:hypothetical protein